MCKPNLSGGLFGHTDDFAFSDPQKKVFWDTWLGEPHLAGGKPYPILTSRLGRLIN